MLKSNTREELGELQQRMSQIRREMHDEVKGAMRGAQSLTDWRSAVATYPWAALGIAAAVGYLAVPYRRSRRGAAAAPLIAPVAGPGHAEPYAAPRPREGLVRSALGLVAPVVARAAQNYALVQLEQWLTAQPKASSRPEHPGEARPGEPLVEDDQTATIRFRDRR